MKLTIVTTPEQDEIIAALNAQIEKGELTDEEYATQTLTSKVDEIFIAIKDTTAKTLLALLNDDFFLLTPADQATVIAIVEKLKNQ